MKKFAVLLAVLVFFSFTGIAHAKWYFGGTVTHVLQASSASRITVDFSGSVMDKAIASTENTNAILAIALTAISLGSQVDAELNDSSQWVAIKISDQ